MPAVSYTHCGHFQITAGILQYNLIQLAISQNLIDPIFATELDYIVKCPQ